MNNVPAFHSTHRIRPLLVCILTHKSHLQQYVYNNDNNNNNVLYFHNRIHLHLQKNPPILMNLDWVQRTHLICHLEALVKK